MFDEREHSPPRHSAADADGANVVCYTVYLPRLPSSSPSSCAPPAPDADRLPDARARAHAELAPLLETYFWHCEPFRLSVVENGGATGDLILRGSTRFGDCIEDEWFVVYLLLRVSELFHEAVISVHDNDGEFLLIEAADALPSWVTPANTTNRVFIHRGTLHLIPLSATPAMHSKSPNRTPNVAEAVEIVRSAATDTRAPPEVDRLALSRARAYPGKIAESFHRAKCLLPQRIALLLREDPRLVTAAVHAFYTRDVDHMKACLKMANFPPSTMLPSPTLVTFTKPSYAQLVSQRFHPPRSFQLPPRSDDSFAAAELGMKLTCGFEILVASLRLETDLHDRSTVETHAFDSDPRWKAFTASLIKYGYFRNELPGSRRYRELEQRAKDAYLVDVVADRPDSDDDGLTMDLKPRLRRLLSLPLPPDDDLVDARPADNYSWMEVTPADLEAMLAARAGSGGLATSSAAEDLGKVAESFRAFVEKGSGLEGAEFPGEDDDDDDNDDDDDDDDDDECEERGSEDEFKEVLGDERPLANAVEFDPDAFVKLLQRTLGVSNEELESMRASRTPNAGTGPPAVKSSIKHAGSFSPDIVPGSEPSSMDEMMARMDAEILSEPKIRRTFETSGGGCDADSPVDLDLAVVENVLESFNAQQGLPGPVGSILGRMGIALPRAEPDPIEDDDTGR